MTEPRCSQRPDSLGLRLHRAAPGDMPAVLALLNEAAAWLSERGVRQWPERWDRHSMAGRVIRGETFLAFEPGDSLPVATISLDWCDPTYWPDEDADAGYVHRLAVRRDRSGRRIGEHLVDWAAARIHAAGRLWIRLDCVATNRELRAYYERQGFQHVRDKRRPGRYRVSLYQRTAAPWERMPG